MRSEYFFGFIISFIAGVGFEEVLNFGYPFALLCATLSLCVFLLRERGAALRYSFFVSLILFGCAAGVLRVDVSHEKQNAPAFSSSLGNVVRMEGVVVDEPDVREDYSNIVLEVHQTLAAIDGAPTKILVRLPVYPEFRYGDEVVLVGKIVTPKNFASKNGAPSFDYRSYLAKDDIYYQMYFPEVTLVSHNKGNIIYEKLFVVKTWLMKNIARMIPEPEASLAEGITLGAKQSLGDDLLQKFRETGVAHIVVLSGYNIAIVAAIISRLFVFMPFVPRLTISAVGVVLFALMVGGGATVVRATIITLIVIFARVLGREGDALRALVLAGGLMVFANSMVLLHDVSFQLSFSAALALVTLAPTIENKFAFIPNATFREIIVTTIATQVFVLPLILYHMGSMSLIGFVANIFILPFVPLAMLLVACVALLSWVPFFGSVFAGCAYLVLWYIIFAVQFFARAPFASLHDVSFSMGALILAYILIGFFILKNFPRTAPTKKIEYEF